MFHRKSLSALQSSWLDILVFKRLWGDFKISKKIFKNASFCSNFFFKQFFQKFFFYEKNQKNIFKKLQKIFFHPFYWFFLQNSLFEIILKKFAVYKFLILILLWQKFDLWDLCSVCSRRRIKKYPDSSKLYFQSIQDLLKDFFEIFWVFFAFISFSRRKK